MKVANDNGRHSLNWQYEEVRGYCPHLTLNPVTLAVNNAAFRQDACNVVTDIIRDVPHRKALDHFMTAWAKWKGRFVDAHGNEVTFDAKITDAIPEEWFRDNFTRRKPSDPPIRLRAENHERLIVVFSLAKILRPADMALCGKRAANDT